MTRMFVANVSPQNHEFQYRIPEQAKTRSIPMKPFGIVPLPDDMNQDQIDAVIVQKEPYGFISADDVKNGRARKSQTCLCYSLGQPMSRMVIDALYQNNYKLLDAQGKELRTAMAVVGNNFVEGEVTKFGQATGQQSEINKFQMTVQEDDSSSREGTSIPILSEGYVVSDTAEASQEAAPKAARARPKKS